MLGRKAGLSEPAARLFLQFREGSPVSALTCLFSRLCPLILLAFPHSSVCFSFNNQKLPRPSIVHCPGTPRRWCSRVTTAFKQLSPQVSPSSWLHLLASATLSCLASLDTNHSSLILLVVLFICLALQCCISKVQPSVLFPSPPISSWVIKFIPGLYSLWTNYLIHISILSLTLKLLHFQQSARSSPWNDSLALPIPPVQVKHSPSLTESAPSVLLISRKYHLQLPT